MLTPFMWSMFLHSQVHVHVPQQTNIGAQWQWKFFVHNDKSELSVFLFLFSFVPIGSHILCLPVLCFYGTPVCVNAYASESMHISCGFSLTPFLTLFCPLLIWFCCCCFILFINFILLLFLGGLFYFRSKSRKGADPNMKRGGEILKGCV